MTAYSLSQAVVAFVATIAFAVLFHVPACHYLGCGLTGGAGWLCYLAVYALYPSPVAASFAAVVVLTGMSMYFAVRFRAPVSVFLICGIFPLVPGAGIYYTAYYFVMNQNDLAFSKGMETIKIAVAIALGIMLVLSIPYSFFRKLPGATPHHRKR